MNLLSITDAQLSDDLGRTADAILGGEGLKHRLIAFRTLAVDESVQADLVARGYQRQSELVMIHNGDASPFFPPNVELLSVEERASVAEQSWSQELPEAPADVWRQLGERIRTVTRAGTATFLATRDASGSVAARADLYVRDGVAQIEGVFTSPGQRGKGFATALLLAAVSRAQHSNASIIFLVADADDWPKAWYARLGFTNAGVVTAWHRTGH